MADTGTGSTIQPDSELSDEGYASSMTTNYVSSIASEIRKGIEENGRLYPAYGKNAYGLPIDENEQDRGDLQHCKFTLCLNGKFHLAPIAEAPQKILDLGTGSGIWAIDMADKHPSAEVIGTDIAAVQPSWVPPNCRFELEDAENDWPYKNDSFDFIHGREFLLAIRDWDRLIEQCFEHVKPGGYLELSGTYPRPKSDDNTLPDDSSYKEVASIFFQISESIGASAEAPRFYKERMEKAGFVDVVERIFKVPTNPWPKDKRLKMIGAFELANASEGLEAFMMRGYTTVLGGDRKDMEVLLARARQEMKNRNMHSYILL
jgi:SAM-dependent methyltransferase